MLAKERQEIILNKINTEGIVSLTKLSEELHASICTIRRDFEKLEKQNLCKRIHGGAVKVRNIERLSEETDLNMNLRKTMNIDEKKILCKKCADLIQDGDCVFVDGGTTFMYLTNYIQDKRVTIVTHNTLISKKDSDLYTLYVLGGENNAKYQMNLGPMVLDYLNYFHFDKAFIGAAGFSLEDMSIYTAEIETAKVKQMAMKKSNRNYLVVDSSKIGTYGFYTMANLLDLQGLITTKKIEQFHADVDLIVCDELESSI